MGEQDDRLEHLEDRVTALEHTTWGVKGDNGMVMAFRELTSEVKSWKADEQRRRDEEAKEKRSASRAIITAAVSSVIALIGVIVTLVVVLTTQGP